jgi:hypothetical protein
MRELVDSSQRLVHFKKTFAIASFELLESMLSRATIVSVPLIAKWHPDKNSQSATLVSSSPSPPSLKDTKEQIVAVCRASQRAL